MRPSPVQSGPTNLWLMEALCVSHDRSEISRLAPGAGHKVLRLRPLPCGPKNAFRWLDAPNKSHANIVGHPCHFVFRKARSKETYGTKSSVSVSFILKEGLSVYISPFSGCRFLTFPFSVKLSRIICGLRIRNLQSLAVLRKENKKSRYCPGRSFTGRGGGGKRKKPCPCA